MTDSEFNTAPRKLLLEGAKLVYKNALCHYDSAQALAANGKYGTANALLILGMEECVKSMALTAGFCGVKLPSSIELFFTSHKVKLGEAEKIQPFAQDMINLLHILNPLMERRKLKGRLINPFAFVRLFFRVIRSFKISPISKNQALFWQTANPKKQAGLYVGYTDGKWLTPLDTPKSAYDQTSELANPFFTVLKHLEEIKPNDYKTIDKARVTLNKVLPQVFS
ncbi:AbiV family abortive infection protein [Parachryseolinea silvisoli]|uniref:AbiV family abortive infection protein n=1 Tax=Parachryseolinea silvisoli TaxID=2873601 RepID=UPI002265E908|nr:AbiV family abortive infection protein [Parachryseolinea silvisoli]MCD9019144.1 AbiV family abortive infection protein [Parachryseolinea silvisoli]